MSNMINISSQNKNLIIYICLVVVILAAFWQVNQADFINLDDPVYVTENFHIQSGITLDGIRWAFSTTYAEFWHPLTWLSLMLDYQLYGLNAGGYHLTNLILHILSTLLLFWLFNRMTGAIWKSAFVAAFFALHPLHVESVAWIAERKDVLSTFFFMLTLCLYVYYTEKPDIKRYLPVVFCFACGLMSKSMVVTLPVILILLDFWPLSRYRPGIESKKGSIIIWQLKEKISLFFLSAAFSVITLYAHYKPSAKYLPLSLESRIANALVSFITYLEKTFLPLDLAVFYPVSVNLPAWQVWGAALLIIAISAIVIAVAKRLPYIFVGWLWYAITIAPVIGIIQIGDFTEADRFTYLPSIGIAVILAWGIPLLFPNENIRKNILFPAVIAVLTIMAVLTWKQCGYWRDSIKLYNHALAVTKNNDLAHTNLASALLSKGKIGEAINHYNTAISLKPDSANFYSNRGNAYAKVGQYQRALEDYNEAIRLHPDFALAYINRGTVYVDTGRYQMALESYETAIRLNPEYADTAYYNRGNIYVKLGQYQHALDDYNQVIRLRPNDAYVFNNRAFVCLKLDRYQQAIDDYTKAISLKPDYVDAYCNRATIYARSGQNQRAIDDYTKVIHLKPDDPSIYFNRGNSYINLGQYQLALEDYNQVIRLKPNDAQVHNNRGFIFLKLGRYQQSVDDYTKAVSLKPDYADAWNNRAFVYLNMNNNVSGCSDARKACKLGNCSTLQAANAKGFCLQ